MSNNESDRRMGGVETRRGGKCARGEYGAEC